MHSEWQMALITTSSYQILVKLIHLMPVQCLHHASHHLRYPILALCSIPYSNEFVPHPGGVSSLFTFVDLVIHSIFHTDPTDWHINKASSYLDLSILYGSNDKQVDFGALRTKLTGPSHR